MERAAAQLTKIVRNSYKENRMNNKLDIKNGFIRHFIFALGILIFNFKFLFYSLKVHHLHKRSYHIKQ